MNKKVAKATKWSIVTEIIAKLISPLANMILARILVPEAFGSVATITMIISFAEVFTDAGFQKYIVQHEFTDDDDFNLGVNVAFWSNFCMSVAATLIIVLFRKNIGRLVGEPHLANGIAVASIAIILVAFSSIQMAVYRRKLDFKTLFLVRVVSSSIPLFVTVPLALVMKNYWSLIIGTLTSNVVQAVLLTAKSSWKPSFRYSFKKLKEMFAFTSWTLLESVSIWLTSYIGTFIVGHALNAHYLGMYKTSMSTVNAYMGIITSAINPVLFATLSRYQDDEQNFRRTFFDFQNGVGIFVIPMGIGIFVFRDFITSLLLGSSWMESSDFIGLWGLMSAITILFSHFYSEVFRSKGKPNVSLVSQLIHLCFLIPAIAVSVNYGFRTLFISRSFIRLQMVAVNVLFAHFMFKLKISETLKNLYPQFISAMLMGTAGYFLSGISNNIIWQFVSIFICVVLYFGILMLFPSKRTKILEMKFIKRFTHVFTEKL